MAPVNSTSSSVYWPAPLADGPVEATVTVPGSKSITNRALIIAALATSPSTVHGALRSRDSDLMIAGLQSMGVVVEEVVEPSGERVLSITPGPLHGGSVDCGLAGTVMRFVPPVAATASGPVFFDGDEEARIRPMGAVLSALRDLGADVDADSLPFTVTPSDQVGGEVEVDASASSQFLSGLLLSGARFPKGLVLKQKGTVPSRPHIDMTVDMLREAGVVVTEDVPGEFVIANQTFSGRDWRIEPDLSNATPFLAAAAVTGGTVIVPNWPVSTTQPGDDIRGILADMGCTVEMLPRADTEETVDLKVTGPAELTGVTIDMGDIGELTPTVAALAALATTSSRLTGIAHLRGHETDRLAALVAEINRLGGNAEELPDGLVITPSPLSGGAWLSYADHRMATAGAIIGLVVPGVEVENIATTAKTLPGFENHWATMLGGEQS